MAFTEQIKLDAKRRSNFECVVCKQPFVEVHHIVPQAEGGPDTLDNACPLCGSCHDLFGANKEKRKQLREMRDFQWEVNEKKRQHPDTIAFNQRLDSLQVQLSGSAQSQQRALEEIKGLMIAHNNQSNVAISRATSVATLIEATGIYIPPPEKRNG